jgi:hypothetical protein
MDNSFPHRARLIAWNLEEKSNYSRTSSGIRTGPCALRFLSFRCTEGPTQLLHLCVSLLIGRGARWKCECHPTNDTWETISWTGRKIVAMYRHQWFLYRLKFMMASSILSCFVGFDAKELPDTLYPLQSGGRYHRPHTLPDVAEFSCNDKTCSRVHTFNSHWCFCSACSVTHSAGRSLRQSSVTVSDSS